MTDLSLEGQIKLVAILIYHSMHGWIKSAARSETWMTHPDIASLWDIVRPKKKKSLTERQTRP